MICNNVEIYFVFLVMEAKHEAKLAGNELSMLRWMCGFKLKNNEINVEDKEFLELDPVSK